MLYNLLYNCKGGIEMGKRTKKHLIKFLEIEQLGELEKPLVEKVRMALAKKQDPNSGSRLSA